MTNVVPNGGDEPVLDSALNALKEGSPSLDSWESAAIIIGLFATAWLVARFAALVARRLLAWHERRTSARPRDRAEVLVQIRRRETSVAILRTAITYVAFAVAALFAVAQLTGGMGKLTALAGASFLLVVAGFAAQRFLIDTIAGLSMFLERWFSVGDTIFVPMMDVQGVVEDVSLRSTKLRTLNGELIHIHNSQIPAVRVLPRGVKELTAEFFVTDKGRGEELVERVVALLPEGPTSFVRRPSLESVESLSDRLVRIRVRVAVAPGREWLAEGFLSSVLKEQAEDELILHGPIVLHHDEGATKTFARAAGVIPGPA